MKIEVNHFGKNIFSVEVDDFNVLEGNPIYIGRAKECHISLDDHTLSREHAKIYYDSSNLYIESLSNYKKIEVNANEVTKSILSLQDKVTISDYTIRISDWDYQNNRRTEDSSTDQAPSEDDDATVILSSTEKDLLVPSEDITEVLDENPLSQVEDSLEDTTESKETLDPIDHIDVISESEDIDEVNSEGDDFENEVFSDEGFGDDSFGDSGFDNDGFSNSDEDSTKVFKSFANYSLRLEGSLAPFDRYAIEENEIYIGRNEDKCQIVLNDPEVSGVHALIKKTFINLIIEDKDSSNGTLVNGERVNKHELKEGDIISIGDTNLIVEIKSELIESEQDMLMPVDLDQEIEIEEIVEEEVDFNNELDFSSGAPKEKGLKGIWKDPAKRKKLIYGLVIIFGMMLFFEDEEVEAPAVKDPKKTTVNKDSNPVKVTKKHSPETLERLEENYALALAKYESGEYYEAKEYLDIVYNIDSEYKDVKTLLRLVKEGYEKLLRLKAEEEAEKERKKRQLEVKKLMVKVVKAVKDRNVKVAESLFAKVLEIDPENLDIPQYKIEIEAYKEKIERDRLEKARKIALRKSMVDALAPGKEDYLKKRWFDAINKLEAFNKKKGMDEDLIKEATDMLKQSKIKLDSTVSPLLGKAKSFKEGQDYKRSYETYGDVLKYDPSNEEALNERNSILERLNNNSRKVYREALISESLSLFAEAKEKFQQVQQISPINSEYYIKATEKLKDYLD